MSTKEKNMDARIAFGNSLSEKRRESGFSQEELGLKIGKALMQYPGMKMQRIRWMYIPLQKL